MKLKHASERGGTDSGRNKAFAGSAVLAAALMCAPAAEAQGRFAGPKATEGDAVCGPDWGPRSVGDRYPSSGGRVIRDINLNATELTAVGGDGKTLEVDVDYRTFMGGRAATPISIVKLTLKGLDIDCGRAEVALSRLESRNSAIQKGVWEIDGLGPQSLPKGIGIAQATVELRKSHKESIEAHLNAALGAAIMDLASIDVGSQSVRMTYAAPSKYGALPPSLMPDVKFAVKSHAHDEVMIRVSGRELKEKVVRLGRSMDLEFLFPDGVYMRVPYHISNVYIGPDGFPKVEVELDRDDARFSRSLGEHVEMRVPVDQMKP